MSARNVFPTADSWLEKMGDWFVPVTETGCWLWLRSLNRGYGQFGCGRNKSFRAHRVSYECLRGPIPDGLTLDHICRQPSCVNPWHLEPVTASVNAMRGDGPLARNARKTHCKWGHEFTPENTYHPPTIPHGRACKLCQRRRKAEHKARLCAIFNDAHART